MWRRRYQGIVALLIATVALAAWPSTPLAPLANAADNGLRMAVDATYRLDPGDGRIRVRMDVTITNLKPNTVDSRGETYYFWNRLQFGIPKEARSVKATSRGSSLSSSTKARDTFRLLTVRFPELRYRQTRTIRIDFDLPGGKPRSASEIRAGRAFASFYAWAWGDPGRSSVRVVLPAGFEPTVSGSTYRSSVVDGQTILTATGIRAPGDWYLVVNAERPDALTDERLELDGGNVLLIHAWPEDDAWLERVRDLLRDAVPALEDEIGLPWPVSGVLEITEVHTPLLEGYAGIYDPSSDKIVITEDLDDLVIVHEAAHAWLNLELLDERWLAEGLADEYASRVLASLGRSVEAPDPVAADDPAAFPLTSWPAPGRIDDDETQAQESFGYDASWTVMRQLMEATGDDAMDDVLAAIQADQTAYVGDIAPETVVQKTDWRRFLDLLQANGADARVERIIEDWVIRPIDRPLLEARAEARMRYAQLDHAADSWAMPWVVRRAMGAWSFQLAATAMDHAEAIIDARDALAAGTSDLALASPTDLEAMFEAAQTDAALDAPEELLAARIAAVDRLAAARVGLAEPRSALVELGLSGETPAAGYEAARLAFEAGDLSAMDAGIAVTEAMLAGAEAVGQSRATTIGAIVVVGIIVLLLMLAVFLRRRSRRRRLATLAATSAPAPGPIVEVPAGRSVDVPPTGPPPGVEPD